MISNVKTDVENEFAEASNVAPLFKNPFGPLWAALACEDDEFEFEQKIPKGIKGMLVQISEMTLPSGTTAPLTKGEIKLKLRHMRWNIHIGKNVESDLDDLIEEIVVKLGTFVRVAGRQLETPTQKRIERFKSNSFVHTLIAGTVGGSAPYIAEMASKLF